MIAAELLLGVLSLPVAPVHLRGVEQITQTARRLASAGAPVASAVDLGLCDPLPPAAGIDDLIVPEGVCYKITTSTSAAYKGIHVVGTLAIDTSASTALAPVHISITAEYIFVEGVFHIETADDDIVPSATSRVEITLVEPADAGIDSFVIESRKAPPAFEPESVGVKAFVVYGGQLSVHALPAACPAWTRVQDVITEPAAQPLTVPAPVEVSPACPDPALTFAPVRTSFEDASERSGWYTDSSGALTLDASTGDAADGSAYASVTGRTKRWGGYLMHDIPTACLVAGERYHFVAKVRTRNEADGRFDTTACALGSNRCVTASIVSPSASDEWLGRSTQQIDAGWLEITDQFEFSAETIAADPSVTLRFYNPEGGETIEVDYVRLERAPPSAYPAPAPSTCAQLAANGEMDLDEFFTWPWYASGGSIGVIDTGGARGRALRSTGRTRSWHGPNQAIGALGCLQPGVTLAISALVRLPSDAACTLAPGAPGADRSSCARIELRTAGGTIGTKYDAIASQTEFAPGAWNRVEGTYTLREWHDAALIESALLRLQVRDDGASAWAEWDSVTVAFVHGPVRTLVLDAAVSPCWAPGAELLITSNTLLWSDARVAIVESVDVSGGSARVRLDRSIDKPTTLADSADFATEVALLERNVVIQGALDALDAQKIGGHLMVMKTSAPQAMHGVLLRRMGQQGRLGRYPAHMHLCGPSPGTVLSRNLVRSSHQRCFVIHGTDETEVNDNVAFETHGHCFMLEDGGEIGNTFARNLGASTMRVDQLIRAEETDDDPSTFWITNPDNTWLDNVAAGSASTGFWFEMRTRVREPTRGLWLPDNYNPKTIPLRKFARNVAHSNSNDGLQTYPGAGYTPTPPAAEPHAVGARFEAMRSYRNRGAGMFFHNSAYLEVSGGVFADNDRGIDVDRAHTCRIDGTGDEGVVRVLGVSELYQAQLGALGSLGHSSRSHCYGPTADPVVGVQLHQQNSGASSKLGTWLGGVRFERLTDADTGCVGARALSVDDEVQGLFDVRTATGALSWAPADMPTAQRVNLCKEFSTSEPEQPDVAIRDGDGSLVGGGGGFVVSDTARMTGLLGSACTSVAGACAAVCPDTCLRQIQYRTSSQIAPGTLLRLAVGDATVDVPAYVSYRVEDTPKETLIASTEQRDRAEFVAVVPAGVQVSASFVGTDGAPAWPLFVQSVAIDEPGACAAGAATDDVTLFVPALGGGAESCAWVANGDFETLDAASSLRVPSWWHDGGGVVLGAETRADGSTNHFGVSDERTSTGHGPVQWLDTRCWHAAEPGGVLTLRARAKLSGGSGGVPRCYSASHADCVRVELRVERSAAAGGGSAEVDFAAQVEHTPDGWNLVAGELELTAELLDGADAVRVLFEGPEGGVALALDDVMLSYTPPSPWAACPAPGGSLVQNGGFDEADTFGLPASWTSAALADQLVVAYAPEGNAYGRSYARSSDNHGPVQMLNPACWAEPVGTYAVRADVRLHAESGALADCLADGSSNCPRFELRVTTTGPSDGVETVHYFDAGSLHGVSTALGTGWDLLGGTLTIPPTSALAAALAGGETTTAVRLSIEEPEPGVEVHVDNVGLTKLPPAACPAVPTVGIVANGGFDDFDADGRPSAWEGRSGSRLLVAVDGARVAARSSGRASRSHGPLARLAEGCHGLHAGDSLIVHAWVKIDVPDGQTSACSESSSSHCIRCTRQSRDAGAAGSNYRSCGTQVTRQAGVWSLLEAQFTLQPDEADGSGEWYLYFEGPETHNDILIDDVWVGELSTLLDAAGSGVARR